MLLFTFSQIQFAAERETIREMMVRQRGRHHMQFGQMSLLQCAHLRVRDLSGC